MPPPFSLLSDRWLPVRRCSGVRDIIHPAQLTEGLDDDPVVALDWPRADFDAAACEFLIGLLATACWREAGDDAAWEEWWHQPPAPEALAARFAPLAYAFLLDGPGPRFLQDMEELEADATPVGALLIDTPGAITLKKNTDLFVKRGRVEGLGRGAAAMALFTLQAFAPAGGAGHRTSLRGGGPMTTLLVPDAAAGAGAVPLWHLLWLNVFWGKDWADPLADLSRVLPWLAPTRVSDRKVITTPEDVHPAQCFWGMPRRIRLDFTPNPEAAPCDLTGVADPLRVRSYRTRPYGTDYVAWSLGHPLTPYYRIKDTDTEWLPLHPQPGRQGYRDWVGLVITESEEGACRNPARVVTEGRERLANLANYTRALRLRAQGFDMDNMKARGFVESEMPVPVVGRALRESLEPQVRVLVAGAREVAGLVSYAVGRTQSSGDPPPSDKGDRLMVRDSFWERTEVAFYQALWSLSGQLAVASDAATRRAITDKIHRSWLAVLRATALELFDQKVPLDSIEERNAERLVAARRDLISAFNGYGKGGVGLFKALSLPPPEPATGKKKGSKKS